MIVEDQIVKYILVCMVTIIYKASVGLVEQYGHIVLLHSEAFPTPTCPFHVRIVKNELIVEFSFHIVHFCAKQRQLSLGIN